jgi:hypothetical protein
MRGRRTTVKRAEKSKKVRRARKVEEGEGMCEGSGAREGERGGKGVGGEWCCGNAKRGSRPVSAREGSVRLARQVRRGAGRVRSEVRR